MDNYTSDFVKALTEPDKSFGEVPFFWWNGDRLDKERLTYELRMLAEKGIAGVQVNYAHMVEGGENNLPFGGYGSSLPGDPYQFSEQWWDFFSYAAKECEKLGMSIGVGDYTIAWIGNGFFTDKVSSLPGMHAVNLRCEKKLLFAGDEKSFGEDVLSVVTYKDTECENPLIIYTKNEGITEKIPPMCEAYIVTLHEQEKSVNPLNPESGKLLVEYYFKEFERRLPDLKKGTLNYFFQDELMFGADTRTLWGENIRTEISEKFGYDIIGFIPHLFFNLGKITPEIRLQYADVKTSVIEEAYFKPIYNFHSSRNLIYGCDQAGRGKKPDEFSDYFRTVRWFTAPGNDTPGRAADLIKVKVNSSISHLYKRPRVWLEGYHSSGWGTTLESITAPTSDNFIFGANLLNLHGLYYSTCGGFFEWAPPDFHFRMPYWDDEKTWLDKYKRLSAILTTGHHECDAALFYPVSSCDYGENAEECINLTFSCAEYLFNHGVDFDFIDFQSVENSICSDGFLKVADEKFKILIFAGVDCIRHSVIDKLKAFLDCGGAAVFCGITPYATDLYGLNSEEFRNEILDILSHPNCSLCASETEVLDFINNKITRSFLPESVYSDDKIYIHKRVHGKNTLFFVRYATKDSVCRFEATGTPYLLKPYTGEIIKLRGTITQNGFTFIKMPLEKDEDTLILFTDDILPIDGEFNTSGFIVENIKKKTELDGEWEFSLENVLDNRYGDFYLPAGGIIGAQARFFDCARSDSPDDIPETYDFLSVPYLTDKGLHRIECSGEQGDLCRYISSAPPENFDSFSFNGKIYTAEVPELHGRYGYICRDDIETEHCEQGWHGLKGRVYDDNIYFRSDCVVFGYIISENKTEAFIRTGDYRPDTIYVNGREITGNKAELNGGRNFICACYSYNEDYKPDYRNSASVKRTFLYFTKKEKPAENNYPLSVSSFMNSDYFRFSYDGVKSRYYTYRFRSVPGFYKLTANIAGRIVSAFCNGKKMTVTPRGKGNFGGNLFDAEATEPEKNISEVIFTVETEDGYEYASAVIEPVELFSGKGLLPCGDTSGFGALINYSGKMIYEKDVMLEKIYTDERIYLDIADAGCTLKIEINGKEAGVFTYKPFLADITELAVNGLNHIKITVSNTLCNHYSTIPSCYSNFPEDAKSGLIGPVTITVKEI